MTYLKLHIQIATVIAGILFLSSCSKDTPKTPQTPKITTNSTSTTPAPQQKSGRVLYARCRACHTLEEGGRHKVGPNLWNILGRKAGSADGYAYSKAMITSVIIWDEDSLMAYIENPAKYLPKNKMAFAGLRKPSDQQALIEYIKANTGAP